MELCPSILENNKVSLAKLSSKLDIRGRVASRIDQGRKRNNG